jgi:hypothetical protein
MEDRAMKKRRMMKKPISFKVSPSVTKALKQMAAEGRKVRVVGEVKHKKLEIDYKDLAAFRRKHPKSTLSFVALNAPFKTKGLSGSL